MKARHQRGRSTGAVAGFLLAIALAACGSGSDGAETAATASPAAVDDAGTSEATPAETTEPAETLSLVAGGSDAGIGSLMMPAFAKAAEEFGVEVDFQPMAQSVALTALVSGEIDLAVNSFINLAQAREAGHETYAFAPAWASHVAIVATPESGIETVDDLIGRPFGTYTRTLSAYTETYSLFADEGYDLESDVELLIADSGGLLEGMLAQGEIDALSVYEPNASRLISAGDVQEVLNVADYRAEERGVVTPVQNWTVRGDWAEEHDMELMRRIAERAYELVTSDFSLYEEQAEGVGLQDDPEGLRLLFERFGGSMAMGSYTDEGLEYAQEDLDEAVEFELIQESHDVDELVWSFE